MQIHFLILLLLFHHCRTCDDEEYGKALTIEDILPDNPADYDKMRPPKKDNKPTAVFFHITVMGIDSVDESSMISEGSDQVTLFAENMVNSFKLRSSSHGSQFTETYAADIFFSQSWKDHRLKLPENMTTEYRLLDKDWLRHLWRPDSFFKNAKQVLFQRMTIPNHYVWLYQSKTILYMVKLTLTLSCAMNFVYYPHDTQECKLQMESLSHTTEELVFSWDPELPVALDGTIELPQQNIDNYYTADCTKLYSTGNFSCLEVVFRLKRRLGYYLFHTYIPTCLIVIMSWVSFWIKPEIAPARVTLGVTSLLTLSTQHAKSQSSLPPVSYIKAIDVFMASCTVFVFLALMEYAVVNVILGDGPGVMGRYPRKVPTFVVKKTRKAVAKVLTTRYTAKQRRARAVKVDKASRYIFPIFFSVLNIIYWIVFWEHL